MENDEFGNLITYTPNGNGVKVMDYKNNPHISIHTKKATITPITYYNFLDERKNRRIELSSNNIRIMNPSNKQGTLFVGVLRFKP